MEIGPSVGPPTPRRGHGHRSSSCRASQNFFRPAFTNTGPVKIFFARLSNTGPVKIFSARLSNTGPVKIRRERPGEGKDIIGILLPSFLLKGVLKGLRMIISHPVSAFQIQLLREGHLEGRQGAKDLQRKEQAS